MKTTMTLTAVLLGTLISSSAFASTGNISFTGSVSDTTCNFFSTENGQNGAVVSAIKLGDYSLIQVNAGATNVIDFGLVGVNSDGTPCPIAPGIQVDFTFTPASGTWDPKGLQNTGTAKGIAVKLMDSNSNIIDAANPIRSYAAATGQTGIPFPYKVQMVKSGTPTAGTVISAVKFAVAYK